MGQTDPSKKKAARKQTSADAVWGVGRMDGSGKRRNNNKTTTTRSFSIHLRKGKRAGREQESRETTIGELHDGGLQLDLI